MIPLRDVIPSRTTPYITIVIIILNVLAWFFELALPRDVLPVFLQVYGIHDQCPDNNPNHRLHVHEPRDPPRYHKPPTYAYAD